MSARRFFGVALYSAVCGFGGSIASAYITIPTVPIGNVGNAADPRDGDPFVGGVQRFGSVSYLYNIGTTEVTNAQYAAFLNAKAVSDPNELYLSGMAGSTGGIIRSGSEGSYSYSTVSGRAQNPVNFVTIWDAMRFTNWLHNGQGNGDTETGAYTLTADGIANNTVARNPDWQWAIASENEWYKAAHHQPATSGGDVNNYWRYPTSSNTLTTADANYGTVIDNTTPAGSYAPNFYGAYDMGGNVWEWNEDTFTGSTRRLRGAAYNNDLSNMGSDRNVVYLSPTDFGPVIGFRVVQVPAPASVALLATGGLSAARRRRGVGR